MSEIAIVEKKVGGWGGDTSLQRVEAKEKIEVWRKHKRGDWLKDFERGHKLGELYTDEEKEVIVGIIAQKIIEESLSMMEAINSLLLSGDIPGNSAKSVVTLLTRWGNKNPELKEMLRAARKERAYALAEEIQRLDIEALNTLTKEREKGGIDPKVANAYATLHKTRTSNIQWIAERVYPDEFSPKMQVTGEIKHTMVSLQIITPNLPKPILELEKE